MPLYQVNVRTTERTGNNTSKNGYQILQIQARDVSSAQKQAQQMYTSPTMTCVASVVKELK